MDEASLRHVDLPQPPSSVLERDRFIVRTYAHLLGAIIAFVMLELLYFGTGLAESITDTLLSVSWLLVLGAFIVVSWFARGLAANVGSQTAQYAGLAAYVVAESIIFAPLLFVADSVAPGAIRSAATLTILGVVGLTAIAFWSGADFTVLRGLLAWGGVLALIAIVGAVLFGLALGTWFSLAMIGLAGGAILYDTSKILRDYPVDHHVGASLELFASVALLFWYVLRLVTSWRD
jgi:FtsH-binding integral membrane protein